jgi:hypothetical protein
VELYNPNDFDVSLKGWSLKDNSGSSVTINANKTVKAHGFALISKDASTWSFWDEDPSAEKVELGKQIGNGLGDDGDHLDLINPSHQLIDSMAWEQDHALWNPAVPDAPPGSSLERLSPGLDGDFAADWETQTPPSPGN